MKTKLFFTILACTFFASGYGQQCESFMDNVMTSNADGAYAVIAADFDGDGDEDAVAGYDLANTIALWRNDGAGNFTEEIITTMAGGVLSLSKGDFNDDGNMDFVAAYSLTDIVAWWANDGSGNFTENVMSTSADGAYSVFADDIDNDGDDDVVAAYFIDDSVAWFENDGSGNFTEEIISDQTDGARSVYAADLDNDGDLDALSASENDGKLAWYEFLQGSGTFGTQQIIVTEPNGAWRVTAANIDSGSNIDVIANLDVGATSRTVWFENDGTPAFTERLIASPTESDWLFPYDIDDDGDIDVISAEFFDNKIVYFQNLDGQGGDFDECLVVEPNPVREWPNCIDVADFNNDMGPDIISTWYTGDVVSWQELGHLGLDDNLLSSFTVYPIPTTGILNIQSKTAIVQIDIYSQLGQLVLSNTNENQIDISELRQGIYYIKVMDVTGDFGTKKVVKK